MAKYNRSAKARAARRWYKNVGDPIDLARGGAGKNPNDLAPTSMEGLWPVRGVSK